MTDYTQLTLILKAVAHPTRLQILDMLRAGETCVCHIENALDKRQAYISQQLMVLREAGLVTYRKDGLQVYYQLAGPHTADLLTLLCGDQVEHEYPAIEGCPCPDCTTDTLLTTKQ